MQSRTIVRSMVSPRWNKRHCLMICWRRSEKKNGSLILRLLSTFGSLWFGLCAAVVGNTFCKNAHGDVFGWQTNGAMEACCPIATGSLFWKQGKFRGVFSYCKSFQCPQPPFTALARQYVQQTCGHELRQQYDHVMQACLAETICKFRCNVRV